MDWETQLEKDWGPFLSNFRLPSRAFRLALIVGVVGLAAVVLVQLVNRPDIAFEGHGSGRVAVGQVALDGLYTMRVTATGAARVYLDTRAGICQWVGGGEPGLWTISAERCVADIALEAGQPVDYWVVLDRR